MNSNPRAIKIVNEFVRPGADQMVGMAMRGELLLTQASVQDSADVFPQTNDKVDDGADGDGRPPATNLDVLAVMQATREFVTWYNTPSQTTGLTPKQAYVKLAVNPR